MVLAFRLSVSLKFCALILKWKSKIKMKRPVLLKNTWKDLFSMFRYFAVIIIVFVIYSNQHLQAQAVNSETQSCYSSAEARYRCFNSRFSGMLERARERAEQRKAILESQAAARLEKEVSPTEIRDLQREEIRKLVEASRKRNVSHRGEKYSLTYGFVLEPRD